MKRQYLFVFFLLSSVFNSLPDNLHAESAVKPAMKELLDTYAAEVKRDDPDFKRFSSDEGRNLYYMTRTHSKKEDRSCTTCHTKDPNQTGRTKVGKPIEPISPAVTADRFTDPKKVEKWFKRNCEWVLERECTAKEKGDYIIFMMSLKQH